MVEGGIMGEVSEHQLIEHIANGIVTECAPQELVLFPEISQAYFKNPQKMRKGLVGKEEILGLDIGSTASIILSPIVLVIVDTMIKSLTEEVAESNFFKRMLVKFHLAKNEEKKVTLPLSLTPAQLREVREKAVAQAIQFELEQKQAELLADSLIGKLSLIEG